MCVSPPTQESVGGPTRRGRSDRAPDHGTTRKVVRFAVPSDACLSRPRLSWRVAGSGDGLPRLCSITSRSALLRRAEARRWSRAYAFAPRRERIPLPMAQDGACLRIPRARSGPVHAGPMVRCIRRGRNAPIRSNHHCRNNPPDNHMRRQVDRLIFRSMHGWRMATWHRLRLVPGEVSVGSSVLTSYVVLGTDGLARNWNQTESPVDGSIPVFRRFSANL